MTATTRILVVDDHCLFLEGMRYLLGCLGDKVEVDQCNRVSSAICRLDRGERYALMLIDLTMPDMDGFSLLQAIRERRIHCPVAVVSATSDPDTVRRAMRAGARGFIPKGTDASTMLCGLRTLLDGGEFLPEALWNLIDDQPLHGDAPDRASGDTGIGRRQMEVLDLLNEGLSNKQIAAVLSVSEATVKYHVTLLFRALGVKSRTACVREAQRRGIIPAE
ncbi:MAG: DNA-binding response regulator [Caldilineae bacterium]|nr:MAG: DNA-binding response regulator [Caldilineae bacterium]